ncbi:glycosyltransferase [Paenibacillus sp. BAC0078]
MTSKILVITRNAWNNGNSTGNTATNLFSNWDRENLANLFCRAELPDNEVCDKYFRITESELIGSTLKNREIGIVANYESLTKTTSEKNVEIAEREKRIYNFFRNNRFHILLWAREILWAMGKWENKKLKEFLLEFNPQIIYMPIHDCFYMHNILRYVKKVTNAKVVLFTGDDMYSLKQFSVSILYWINRFILRRKIRSSIKMADICYCMSDIQISEFKNEFGGEFKILRKGITQAEGRPRYSQHDDVINFVYTGNITNGRWKTLAAIGRGIHALNNEKVKARLYIYTTNSLTNKMKRKLNFNDEVIFMGSVLPSKIRGIQQKADVVVHVESFELKYKLQTRLSFSTKLVDYFQNGKCILAVGWERANSIDYLVKNDAAIVATNKEEIINKLKEIINNPAIITEYSEKSWECGVGNHQIDEIQHSLYNDLNYLVDCRD